ncbi:MAG: putative rane protein [Herbinix sp.]|jgi:hypothetical protein|nr:putative rane protein [Herbinix sp.]
MKNKRDINMYINYERSYRNRRRRGSHRILRTIFTLFFVLLVGTAVYFTIQWQIDRESEDSNTTQQEKLIAKTDADSKALTDSLPDDDNEKNSIQNLNTEEQIPLQNTDISNDPSDPYQNPNTGENPSGEQEVDTIDQSIVQDSDFSIDQTDHRIPVTAKGIYVTSKVAGASGMNDLIQLVETTEINAMVIDVKDDYGKITYEMDSKLAKETNAITRDIKDMKTLVQTLKDKNIYLIARIVAFKDPHLAEQRQDLAIRNPDGTLFRDNRNECWVNPYKKEVWDYLMDIATRAAAIGFDEIQFDYIRFSTGKGMSEVDFGEEAKDKTKEDIILEFTKYAYERLKPLGVFVSADVYGTIISSKIDAGLVGQNYIEMAKYLDYICPMIYPSHFGEGNYGIQYPDLEPYQIIKKVLTASKMKLTEIPEGEHRADVRPWLQDFTASWLKNHKVYGADEIKEQIAGVYGAGYSEFILWNAACNYTEEGLQPEE